MIRISLRANEDVRGLGLRVEIRSANEMKIGTYFYYDICDCRKGETVDIITSQDISSLTDGTYLTYYTFFNRDNSGNNLDLDCVPGLPFIHVDSTPASLLHWNSNWGFTALDGGELVEVKKTGNSD